MKVGDCVRIITDKYENNGYGPHYGRWGKITSGDGKLWLLKRDDDNRSVWYGE
jgi:hypothetical protein